MSFRKGVVAFQLAMALPVTVYYIVGILPMVLPGAGVLILGAPLFIGIYAFLFLAPLLCGLFLTNKSAPQSASTFSFNFAKLSAMVIALISLEIVIGYVVTRMEHGVGLTSSILQPIGTAIALIVVLIHEFESRRRRAA